jgi:hypothetical protein
MMPPHVEFTHSPPSSIGDVMSTPDTTPQHTTGQGKRREGPHSHDEGPHGHAGWYCPHPSACVCPRLTPRYPPVAEEPSP